MFDCYQICIQKRTTRQSYLFEKMYLNNAHVQYIHIFVFLSGINQSEGDCGGKVIYKELWKKEWQSFPVISWQSAYSHRRDILKCVNLIIFTQLINIYGIYQHVIVSLFCKQQMLFFSDLISIIICHLWCWGIKVCICCNVWTCFIVYRYLSKMFIFQLLEHYLNLSTKNLYESLLLNVFPLQ